ncbi:MAG: nucleotide exchange factor GrpE [Candidatus Carbobacillus sp.]|nr:nucleotide exchange factor GrpE [Candidatus Carbobacillus sp.]
MKEEGTSDFQMISEKEARAIDTEQKKQEHTVAEERQESTHQEGVIDQVIQEDDANDLGTEEAPEVSPPCQAYEEQIQRLEAELAQERERTLRALAEFENYRRRMQRELEQTARYGIRPLVESILPTIDNFERALNSRDAKDDPFYQGVVMIHRQLLEALYALGITEIKDIDVPFDPTLHQAVGMVESTSPDQRERVAEVLQKGYLLHDRLIRPAMVKVYS